MIQRIYTYRFECDWPHGCLMKMTVHGAETLAGAKAQGRRNGWTFTRISQGEHVGRELARCPAHAFMFAEKPAGRPRRKSA